MNKQCTLAGGSLASVLAATLLASAFTASAQSLGEASGYNYFIFGNTTLTYTDVEGRAAIGGDATFTGYGVGDKLPANAGGYSLVVGGNLTYQNGQVFEGNVIYGGTSTTSGFNVRNGTISQGTAIDFNAAQSQLTSLAASLAGGAINGAYNNYYGTLQFTGTDSNLNSFIVQAADINSSHGFQISAPSGSTVVINVAGTHIDFDYMGISLSGTDKSRVLYNFYEATSINIAGISVLGSILAPYANVNFTNGNVEGTLVAASLTGSGEFHHVPFQGNLPVPEPTSLTLAALAGVTILFRRRR